MITEEDHGVPTRDKPKPKETIGFTNQCKQALFNYFANYHSVILMEDDFSNISHIIRELND